MSKRMQRDVWVVGGSRTPFVKSFAQYQKVSLQDMLTATLADLAQRFGLRGKTVGDVALGSVMTHSKDWNLAREVVLGSGLSADTPAYNVQRACGTSLETAWQLALKIGAGQMETAIAGGGDTNSDLAVTFPRSFAQKILALRAARSLGERIQRMLAFRPKDFFPQFPAVVEPRTGKSMGQHCELMVQEWKIPRADQDQLTVDSHERAAAAYKQNFFSDLVFKYQGLDKDSILRADTSMEKLAKLKPAFDKTGKGTLTAGNSTALTDGASAVLLASESAAKANGWPTLARFVDAEVAAVDFVNGAGLLMAPTKAVSKLLERNGLTLQDFDFYEIHEAFAGQVLCTLRAWESAEYCQRVLGRSSPLGSIDRKKMNVKGGSVALGHPFGATGARIVAAGAKILAEKGQGRVLISVCTGGGMGVAAILER